MHGGPRLRAPADAAARELSGRARPGDRRPAAPDDPRRLVDALRRPDARTIWSRRRFPTISTSPSPSRASRKPTPTCAKRTRRCSRKSTWARSARRSRSSGAVTTPVPIRLTNDLRVALSTSFEIDFWGRLRRMVESARAQALATHYAKDVVTLSLAGLTDADLFRAALARRADHGDARDARDARGQSRHRAAPRRQRARIRSRSRPGAGRALGRGRTAQGPRAPAGAGGAPAGNVDRQARPQISGRRPGADSGAARPAARPAVVADRTASGHPRGRGEPGRRQRADRRRQGGVAAAHFADRILRRRKPGLELARSGPAARSGRSALRCRCRYSPRAASTPRSTRRRRGRSRRWRRTRNRSRPAFAKSPTRWSTSSRRARPRPICRPASTRRATRCACAAPLRSRLLAVPQRARCAALAQCFAARADPQSRRRSCRRRST